MPESTRGLADPAAFVLRHTRWITPPLVPELRVCGSDVLTGVWEALEAESGHKGQEPPFWAFAWPGSQALARWFLDNPAELAGLRVWDIGAGGGLAAIAAARGGARATANDVDALSLVAARVNAEANGVRIETSWGDLAAADTDLDADLVVVGDLCYERDTSERLLRWLARLARTRRVIVSESGRAFAPRDGVRAIARYTVPTPVAIEDRAEREVVLLEVAPAQ